MDRCKNGKSKQVSQAHNKFNALFGDEVLKSSKIGSLNIVLVIFTYCDLLMKRSKNVKFLKGLITDDKKWKYKGIVYCLFSPERMIFQFISIIF